MEASLWVYENMNSVAGGIQDSCKCTVCCQIQPFSERTSLHMPWENP